MYTYVYNDNHFSSSLWKLKLQRAPFPMFNGTQETLLLPPKLCYPEEEGVGEASQQNQPSHAILGTYLRVVVVPSSKCVIAKRRRAWVHGLCESYCLPSSIYVPTTYYGFSQILHSSYVSTNSTHPCFNSCGNRIWIDFLWMNSNYVDTYSE